MRELYCPEYKGQHFDKLSFELYELVFFDTLPQKEKGVLYHGL